MCVYMCMWTQAYVCDPNTDTEMFMTDYSKYYKKVIRG